jgi:hypothetical protein
MKIIFRAKPQRRQEKDNEFESFPKGIITFVEIFAAARIVIRPIHKIPQVSYKSIFLCVFAALREAGFYVHNSERLINV